MAIRPTRAWFRRPPGPRVAPFAAGLALLANLLTWLAAAPSAAEPAVTATGVRVGLHGPVTRFVVDLSEKVPFEVFTLADPYRVVIDLSEIKWRLPTSALPAPTGLFERVRYGLYRPGTSRLVLDLSAPATVNEAFLIKPLDEGGYRLVVDLAATGRDAFLGSVRGAALPRAASAPPPAAPVGRPAAPAIAKFVPPPPRPSAGPAQRVVVIDPGHGGADPGAIGVSGVHEKDVTLAAARDLRSALERLGGYRVVLTRDDDRSVSLRERIAIARRVDADLFVSLHADAMPSAQVRGASVYTLSETASDAEAALLAERENKADLITGVDLTYETAEVANILIDLAQRETKNRSARLAARVVDELQRETQLLRNTHRFAGFAVLKAPDVPSVLVELGFLSNRQDEQALRDTAYRRRLAAAIARGIDRYFVGVEQAALR